MQLRTEIEIAATPEKIWNVLTDFRAYPEWNPFIVRISGRAQVGEKLEVVLSPPQKSEYRFSPEVVRADPGKEFRWRGKFWFGWLLTGEHFFRLEPIDAEQTRLTHGEDFSGLGVRLLPMTDTARGFVFMNQALKRRAESF
jgi:hypothetical protein